MADQWYGYQEIIVTLQIDLITTNRNVIKQRFQNLFIIPFASRAMTQLITVTGMGFVSGTVAKAVGEAAVGAALDYLVEGEVDYERLARNLVINVVVALGIGALIGEAWEQPRQRGNIEEGSNPVFEISREKYPNHVTMLENAQVKGHSFENLERGSGTRAAKKNRYESQKEIRKKNGQPPIGFDYRESETYDNGMLKKLVLNLDVPLEHEIFRVAGLIEYKIIVSMAVAESMLRRKQSGFRFVPVSFAKDGAKFL